MAKKERKALPHLQQLVSGKLGPPKTEWLQALLKVYIDLKLEERAFNTAYTLIDKEGDKIMKNDTKINKWHLVFGLLFLACGFVSFTGCAPVISKPLREQVAKGLTLSEVLKSPEVYKGKIILWSGVIISSVNLKKEGNRSRRSSGKEGSASRRD